MERRDFIRYALLMAGTIVVSPSEIIKSKKPLDEVMDIIGKNPEKFTQQEVEDIEMYAPIYEAAGKKFGIDWYLLWIIHNQESGCSRDEMAFVPGALHYGAMQRAVGWYSKDKVGAASEDLLYLRNLPQRHFDDWEEIAWAASKLRADMDNAQRNGKGNLVLEGLYSYSRKDIAEARFEAYEAYKPIFMN